MTKKRKKEILIKLLNRQLQIKNIFWTHEEIKELINEIENGGDK